jgi:hypothetical protein
MHQYIFESAGTYPITTPKVTDLTDDTFKAIQSLNCGFHGVSTIVIVFVLILNLEIGTLLFNLSLNYFDLWMKSHRDFDHIEVV